MGTNNYLLLDMVHSIIGRYFVDDKPVRICWEDSRIVKIETHTLAPDKDLWIATPLFDLQINGFDGVDFQKDNLLATDIIKAVVTLHQHGCLKFLLTLITDDWERIILKLKRLKQIRDNYDLLRNSIVGWHIEGPFLSDKPGFCGIHNPQKMINPTVSHIYELYKIVGKDKVLLTIAPERQGALDVIDFATSLGFTVFLGHTDASSEIIHKAIDAGAKGFTHLGNGCPPLLERKDNIIWRVLDCDNLVISLIPDGIHVSPSLFRIIHKVKKRCKICYVSDAISAAGSLPGRYTLGDIEVEVAEDEIVWNPSRTGFAGSALSPFEGVLRAWEMLGERWQSVWEKYSFIPAQFIGLSHDLKVGGEASFVLLRQCENKKPSIEKVFFMGEKVYP